MGRVTRHIIIIALCAKSYLILGRIMVLLVESFTNYEVGKSSAEGFVIIEFMHCGLWGSMGGVQSF